MRNFLLGFGVAALLMGGGYWIYSSGIFPGRTHQEHAAVRYQCPMHPQVIQDGPGTCPICGMDLVPVETSESTASESHPSDLAHALYHCPMHPEYTQEGPGKCPICGMPLVPVEEATGGAGSHDHSSSAAQSASELPPIPGYVPVRISPERGRVMGLTTAKATRIALEETIRTVGVVTIDETRLHHVHTRFDGYIEELFVNYEGQYVNEGDPLFSVYSPELFATQKEYLLALRARDSKRETGFDPIGETESGFEKRIGSGLRVDLVDAARQRLELWDISDSEIRRIEQTREPIRALLVRSPVSGFVTARTAVQGLRVMPGDNLYDIVDLRTVWVEADIYESSLPLVRVGQNAEFLLPYQPGVHFEGKVTFINPTLDQRTRTVKARLEFANPKGLLKPEMFGDVLITSARGYGIAVPTDAVLSTGERDIVFVASENGMFEPREVRVGIRIQDQYEIRSGLKEGDEVATGANFLLDSESRLKAAIK